MSTLVIHEYLELSWSKIIRYVRRVSIDSEEPKEFIITRGVIRHRENNIKGCTVSGVVFVLPIVFIEAERDHFTLLLLILLRDGIL